MFNEQKKKEIEAKLIGIARSLNQPINTFYKNFYNNLDKKDRYYFDNPNDFNKRLNGIKLNKSLRDISNKEFRKSKYLQKKYGKYKDSDGDGKPNWYDCYPLDKNRKGILGSIGRAIGKVFKSKPEPKTKSNTGSTYLGGGVGIGGGGLQSMRPPSTGSTKLDNAISNVVNKGSSGGSSSGSSSGTSSPTINNNFSDTPKNTPILDKKGNVVGIDDKKNQMSRLPTNFEKIVYARQNTGFNTNKPVITNNINKNVFSNAGGNNNGFSISNRLSNRIPMGMENRNPNFSNLTSGFSKGSNVAQQEKEDLYKKYGIIGNNSALKLNEKGDLSWDKDVVKDSASKVWNFIRYGRDEELPEVDKETKRAFKIITSVPSNALRVINIVNELRNRGKLDWIDEGLAKKNEALMNLAYKDNLTEEDKSYLKSGNVGFVKNETKLINETINDGNVTQTFQTNQISDKDRNKELNKWVYYPTIVQKVAFDDLVKAWKNDPMLMTTLYKTLGVFGSKIKSPFAKFTYSRGIDTGQAGRTFSEYMGKGYSPTESFIAGTGEYINPISWEADWGKRGADLSKYTGIINKDIIHATDKTGSPTVPVEPSGLMKDFIDTNIGKEIDVITSKDKPFKSYDPREPTSGSKWKDKAEMDSYTGNPSEPVEFRFGTPKIGDIYQTGETFLKKSGSSSRTGSQDIMKTQVFSNKDLIKKYYDEIRTTGGASKETIRAIGLAMKKESEFYNRPIAFEAPARGKGSWEQELAIVFPKNSLKGYTKILIGFNELGRPIYRLTNNPKDFIRFNPIANWYYNLKSVFKNKDREAELWGRYANYKKDILDNPDKNILDFNRYDLEGYGGKHGKEHIEAVDPMKIHDISKLTEKDIYNKPRGHGRMTYEAIKRNKLDKNIFKEFYNQPKSEQMKQARAELYHEDYKPLTGLFTRGMPNKETIKALIESSWNKEIPKRATLDRLELARYGIKVDERLINRNSLNNKERIEADKTIKENKERWKLIDWAKNRVKNIDNTNDYNKAKEILEKNKRIIEETKDYYNSYKNLDYYPKKYDFYKSPEYLKSYDYKNKEYNKKTDYENKENYVKYGDKTDYKDYKDYNEKSDYWKEENIIKIPNPTEKKESIKIKLKNRRKAKAFMPIVLDKKGKELPLGKYYGSRKEAQIEGEIFTDETPFNKFRIKSNKVPQNLIRTSRVKKGRSYKFSQQGNLYNEKPKYRRDKSKEKGNFNWMGIMSSVRN